MTLSPVISRYSWSLSVRWSSAPDAAAAAARAATIPRNADLNVEFFMGSSLEVLVRHQCPQGEEFLAGTLRRQSSGCGFPSYAKKKGGADCSAPPSGNQVSGNLVPVALVVPVAATALRLIMRGNPDGIRVRRKLPMARHPLVAAVAPRPVAGDPLVVGAGRNNDNLL